MHFKTSILEIAREVLDEDVSSENIRGLPWMLMETDMTA